MSRTLELIAEVPPNREVTIHLPPDVPIGTALLVLEVRSETEDPEILEDLTDARQALEEAEQEGTISLAELKVELEL